MIGNKNMYLLLCTWLLGCDGVPEKVGHVYLPGKSRMIRSENLLSHRLNVYPDVIDYEYNDNYLVVKQIPNVEKSVRHLGFDLYFRYTSYAHYLRDTSILQQTAYAHYRPTVHLDSINYMLFNRYNLSDKNTSRDIELRTVIADSLIQHDPYYKRIYAAKNNYWIIDNKNNTLLGPFTRGEFLKAIKKFQLPDRFKLTEND